MPAPTFRADQLSWRVRAYNAASRLRPRRHFDAAALVRAAEKQTGLSDFGADDFREPLAVLVDSLEHDASLSPFGRRSMQRYVVDALSKRLRIEHCLRERPEILQQRIERPLFIVGMPRTGSTHLHHLFAADPSVRAPAFYELLWPTPPPAPSELGDPRVERARRAVAGGLATMPELAVLHIHEAEGPEECHFLLEAALLNPLIPGGERYERWWQNTDLRAGYRYYARQLALLGFRSPGRHWVLKAPFHSWHLDALAEVFPDAGFIVTHRDPREVVPSAASYAAVRSRTFYDRFDPEAQGRSVLESLAGLVEAGMRHRATLPPERFHDVSYRALLADPLAVVRDATTHFGFDFDARAERAVQQQIARSPQNKHGVHRYSAEQFGLDDQKISERFARYVQAYGAWL